MAYPASMYNTDKIYIALKAYDIKGSCKAGYIHLQPSICTNI